MKSHRNAKTNVYQRQLLIQRVRRDGWTQAAAAAAHGFLARMIRFWMISRGNRLGAEKTTPSAQTTKIVQIFHVGICSMVFRPSVG